MKYVNHNMYETLLQQIGLTNDQITVYETVLKNSPIKASKLAQKTPFKRVLVYKLLNDLVQMGLVEKDDIGKILLYKPAHPYALQKLIETRERQIKNVEKTLSETLPSLISDFNLVSGKPGVRFFEGIEGLRKIYNDILETGENFYLIRSAYEPVYRKEIVPILDEFIKKRVKRGIRVTALTPRDQKGKASSPEEDARVLYARQWVQKEDYNAPVEIDIYGNKIAMLSFGKEVIGIIIESPQIAKAMKQLFLLSNKGAVARNG